METNPINFTLAPRDLALTRPIAKYLTQDLWAILWVIEIDRLEPRQTLRTLI